MLNDANISAIVQLIIGVATPIILLLFYKVITLIETKLQIQLSDQQRTIIKGAVETGAGLLENSLKKGFLTHEEIGSDNPKVNLIRQLAMQNVQESLSALKVHPIIANNMIISRHALITKNKTQ